MPPLDRSLVVINGDMPDRISGYPPTVACDVASKILGREVNTGTPSLWYAEAKAWMAVEAAFAEFEHKLVEDRLELHQVWRYYPDVRNFIEVTNRAPKMGPED